VSRVNALVVLATAALVVGGYLLLSGHDQPRSAPAAHVTSCLRDTLRVDNPQEDLAAVSRVTGFNTVHVRWPDNSAVVFVQRDDQRATSPVLKALLRRVQSAASTGGPLVKRIGAVVVSYDHAPTAGERSALERCVRA
jgi:hypothetical protein